MPSSERPSVQIRDARDEDAEDLARLCTELGYPSAADAMPARLARLRAAGSTARAFVGCVDGAVLGLATVHRRDTLNHDAPIAQLTLLVVDARARRTGVGAALVREAEAWARAAGAKRLVVTTTLDRVGAHAFYEGIGFTHTGRRYAKDLR